VTGFAQVAAGRAMDRHGGYKQRQISARPEVEICALPFDVGAIGDLSAADTGIRCRSGSCISCATSRSRPGKPDGPRDSERTMMYIASGNCEPNLPWRRMRATRSVTNGSSSPTQSAAARRLEKVLAASISRPKKTLAPPRSRRPGERSGSPALHTGFAQQAVFSSAGRS